MRETRLAPLLAKGRTQQSTRFKLADQGLDLGKTTPPVNRSHFAHCPSATLNAKQEQGALLRRIREASHRRAELCAGCELARVAQADEREFRHLTIHVSRPSIVSGI